MNLVVVSPPDPIVTPEDFSGVTTDDAAIAAMIAAATGKIDGPAGWLGRCLGEQTLELRLAAWPCGMFLLPCQPIIEVESIAYIGMDDIETTVEETYWALSGQYLWFRSTWTAPSLGEDPLPIKIRYRAGYDGVSLDEGGTGNVPEEARRAIILSVQYMRALGKDDLFLRAEEVDGVGRREYTVSEQAGAVIEKACNNLLQGLRLYS